MMNKTRNFTKVGTLYLIANVFEKATAFFLLPILTRLLSTTDYGITSTYQSYLDILGVIIGLSLTNSLRGAIVDYKDSLNEYLSSILFLETLSSLAFTILIVFVGRFVFPNQYHILVVICPVHAFASIIISGLSLKCMLEGRYILRTILSVAPPFISIFTSIILIKSMSDNLYLGRVFGMYSGRTERVKMEFDNSLSGVVIDKFGKDVNIVKTGAKKFLVIENVNVSKQFFGWIFGLGEGAKIVGPQSVVDEMNEEMMKRLGLEKK